MNSQNFRGKRAVLLGTGDCANPALSYRVGGEVHVMKQGRPHMLGRAAAAAPPPLPSLGALTLG